MSEPITFIVVVDDAADAHGLIRLCAHARRCDAQKDMVICRKDAIDIRQLFEEMACLFDARHA